MKPHGILKLPFGGFLKWGAAPNHLVDSRIFHKIKHPAALGSPQWYKHDFFFLVLHLCRWNLQVFIHWSIWVHYGNSLTLTKAITGDDFSMETIISRARQSRLRSYGSVVIKFTQESRKIHWFSNFPRICPMIFPFSYRFSMIFPCSQGLFSIEPKVLIA